MISEIRFFVKSRTVFLVPLVFFLLSGVSGFADVFSGCFFPFELDRKQKLDLVLDDIILLDILQKNGQISKEAADNLRKKKLIEGRYPKVYPAENVAISTGKLDEYLDNKAYDDAFYIQKILEFLCKKGQASRQEITQLIKKHLSPLLTDEQKDKKIGNLLSTKMSSKLHFVTNIGTRKPPSWVITEEGMAACRSANPDCKKECRKR